MQRAVAYCRVSTKEQLKNLSLPTQESACVDWCKKHGLEVVAVFHEQGESAKTANRTELTKLLAFCEKQRRTREKIDLVVFYDFSRFTRNAEDFTILKVRLRALNIGLRSVTQETDDTPAGKLMETLLTGVAEFENNMKAQRTREGMRTAAAQGRWTWQAPLGYVTNPIPKSRPSILPDEKTAPMIERAFALVEAGETPSAALRRLTDEGFRTAKGKRIALQGFIRLLKNPLYNGMIILPKWGITVRGDFAPIVAESIFENVQLRLRTKGRSVGMKHRRDNADFVLRRFVRCSQCGRPLTGSWSTGRTKKYPYYRCTSKKCRVNVRRDELESSFAMMLAKIQPRSRYMPLFKAIVADVWRTREDGRIQASERLNSAIAAIAAKRQKLFDAFVYDEAISRPLFDAEVARLDADEKQLRRDLDALTSEIGSVEDLLWFADGVLSDPQRSWFEYGAAEKVRFQTILFPRGLQFDGKNFGTAETSSLFSTLRAIDSGKGRLASPTGFEPVLPP